MKTIQDNQRLSTYIETFDLQDYMDNDLLSMATLQLFEKEEHLIRAETPSEYLYFLVEGTVMVYSFSSDTQTICIDYAQPAAPLGEASSLWELVPKSSVKAASSCICVSIPLKRYRATLQQDVRFLQTVCQLLSYRLNAGINLANSLTTPVETRLAKFMLDNQENQHFTFQLTTCAAILNVSYRHLLRTVTNFREDKLIEKDRKGYTLLNIPALTALAENLSYT
ncbi:cyclic nucleotide-binding domain-containing protein [Enterococcus sp. DIV0876]|uniref:cyclic nucleotide-binding domain-containing protein n=1 Tax=Enterococcus sp. DIV0876 TaxID=2774633 RepID=UPI003D2FBE38